MNLRPIICALVAAALACDTLYAQPARESQSRTRRAQRDSRPSPEPAQAYSKSQPLGVAVTEMESSETPTSACESAAIKAAVRSSQLDENGEIAVGFSLEAPSPAYDFDGSNLTWRQPADLDTHYLLVTMQDAVSSHTLPGSKVVATLTDGTGKDAVSSATLPEMWDPRFRHYGINVNLPATMTTGVLSITCDPPNWRRRGRKDGAFFVKQASFKFADVDFTTSSLTRFEPPDSAKPEEKIVWPKGRRQFVEPTPYPGSQPQ
jgi:hypothetical protein